MKNFAESSEGSIDTLPSVDKIEHVDELIGRNGRSLSHAGNMTIGLVTGVGRAFNFACFGGRRYVAVATATILWESSEGGRPSHWAVMRKS